LGGSCHTFMGHKQPVETVQQIMACSFAFQNVDMAVLN